MVKEKNQPQKGDYVLIGNDYYSILPDPSTIYYLYNSIKLFYQNGGGDCYIISVGTYGGPSGKPITSGEQIVNPNVKLTDLTIGLALLLDEQEPTMYICPEATLLSLEENSTLMQSMLLQNQEMQTCISVFDIIGGKDPNPITFMNDIVTFREGTGTSGLKYGAAYYPFIGTTIMQSTDFDYNNLFGGDVKQLQPILSPPSNPNPSAVAVLNNIENPSSPPLSVSQNNNALIVASNTYVTIINHIKNDSNLLPPSGGMAGVMTTVDNQQGVWVAPANVSIVSVVSLPINLTEIQQGSLNVDAISGKSINAIRFFNGIGILVWGARTMDGNSMDWRYISVRRTIIMLEQSCKLATQSYVFEPNVRNTWEAVKTMIGSYLSTVWKEGGLQGAKATDAFSVNCGLGSTMTSEDIVNGIMRVTLHVALMHPAEFIVISIDQQMATPS